MFEIGGTRVWHSLPCACFRFCAIPFSDNLYGFVDVFITVKRNYKKVQVGKDQEKAQSKIEIIK